MNSDNSKIAGLAGLANNDLSRNIGNTLINKSFDMAKQSNNQVETGETGERFMDNLQKIAFNKIVQDIGKRH